MTTARMWCPPPSRHFSDTTQVSTAKPAANSMLAASARRAPTLDSKSAEAYRSVKDMIVSLELPPGALLDERALAASIELAAGLAALTCVVLLKCLLGGTARRT